MGPTAKATFHGGARALSLTSGQTLALPAPFARVIRANVVSGVACLQLPNPALAASHCRRGGPQVFILCPTSSGSGAQCSVLDHIGNLVVAVPRGSFAEVHLGSEGWFGRVRTGSLGLSTPIPAQLQELEITVGPGVLSDINLRDIADDDLGYDGARPAKILVTVLPGTFLHSTVLGEPALDTGAWPAGSVLELENGGLIYGAGGDGGTPASSVASARGGPGGPAMRLQLPTTLDNTGGLIAGGGGGGGAVASADATVRGASGGGGGGAGFPAGAGGSAGGAGVAQAGRGGSDPLPGFGGAGDMSIATTGHNGVSALACLFNPRSGGQGGHLGMMGVSFDSAGWPNHTGGAPGAAFLGGEHLNLIEGKEGLIQGWAYDEDGESFKLWVGGVCGPLELTTYMRAAGWDGSARVDAEVFLLPGAVMHAPRGVVWEGATTLFVAATFIVTALPATSTVTVTNRGTIFGAAGWGGSGGESNATAGLCHNPMAGEPGRDAVYTTQAITWDNADGRILAGGGGGGGGPGGATLAPGAAARRGGSGGAGQAQQRSPILIPAPSALRRDGSAPRYASYGLDADGRRGVLDPSYIKPGEPILDVDSRATSPGSGLRGYEVSGDFLDRNGGDGGAHGIAGQPGSGADNEGQAFAAGGAAGRAIVGSSLVTFTAAGTVVGALVP